MAGMNTAKYLRYAILIGFLALVGGAFYWQIGQRETLVAHPSNPHVLYQRRWLERGGILDSRGEVIADSAEGSHGFRRVYQGTPGLAPIIGYYSLRYGVAGIEKTFDGVLMGQKYPGTSLLGRAKHSLFRQAKGYDLVTTIDLRLQREIERIFGNHRGAVVVMEVRTGRILAVASTPGFLPNDIDAHWQDISTHDGSPLYNRAFAGFYPPGSTFKLVVLAAGLSRGITHLESVFDDRGMIKIEGHQIANVGERRWGQISLIDACAVSSNVVFIELGQKIGARNVLEMAAGFGIGQEPPLVADSLRAGKLPSGDISNLELAEVCIGQHGLVTTPLQLAMVVQAIANDGLMMEPMLIDAILDDINDMRWNNAPKPMRYVITPTVARDIKEAMTAVVSRGTGRRAALPEVSVAGKTGSAENPQGSAHAWFVGMAPAMYPEICLAVIVENGGSGGDVAAPLARDIFRAYFRGEPRALSK